MLTWYDKASYRATAMWSLWYSLPSSCMGNTWRFSLSQFSKKDVGSHFASSARLVFAALSFTTPA